MLKLPLPILSAARLPRPVLTGRTLAASLALAGLLTGCATGSPVSPVEVTRFVGQQPSRLGTGTIAVRAAAGDGANPLEFAAYEQAVSRQLAQLGYTIIPLERASQVADVRYSRSTSAPQARRSPVSVGVGGSTGSYGSGLGVGLGINLGGKPAQQIGSEIGVIIRDRLSNEALWEGRAHFTASTKSPAAANTAAADKLAAALFSHFPGNSGETVEVR